MRIGPRLSFTLVSLALTLALLPVPARAQWDDTPARDVMRTGEMVRKLLASRVQRLGTSAGADPDTVYVGKSFTNHTAPDNYWNIYTGTYRPGTGNAANALWDWDNTGGLQAPDSLQGWWPTRRQYNSTGALTLTDDQRPWWAIDHGNIGNYVLSQGAAAKRTFGVVGYWHADPGNGAGSAMMWAPLSGTRSAWCGLREHGDNSVVDQQTKNPYNQDVVQFLHDGSSLGGGSPQRFPGYVDQMDQMLYRDVAMTPAQSLTLSFKYRTRMSTSISTTASTRTGWFHGDPLAVVAGNFISSSAAGANAPQDSFMVYVGAPVNDAACVYSDGVTRPVYDAQRRWFSEVIKVFGAGNNYYEIFAATGNNPADTLSATPVAGPIVVPPSVISSVLGGAPGNVRLVFRCKTNRGFADSDSRYSGYNSAGRGAVLLDDVTADTGSGPVVIGDFETPEQGGANAIDNRFPLSGGLTGNDVWRSTGKPPAEYMHVEAVSGLNYNDMCGPPDSPARHCNLTGLVVTVGNHDDGEKSGDSRFTAFREVSHVLVSPTINLVPGPGGVANSMGLSASIVHATSDFILFYDIYAGMLNLSFTGNSWSFGSQCYPATMPNGGKCWGQPGSYAFPFSTPFQECFTDFEGYLDGAQPFLTSNPSGVPDSLRLNLTQQQWCFRFGITLGCNSDQGAYFDNVAIAFVDLPNQPGQASDASSVLLGAVSGDIWQWVNDAFPANETAGLPGTAAFDTTSALIRTGLNNAQATNDKLRFDIPGDSTVVTAANATVTAPDDPNLATVRVDMVFRILPGPGNYQIAAGRTMAPGGSSVTGVLLQVPTNQGAVATAGDASFWGQYMANPGEVSAGVHTGPGGWDPLVWNSARCDTAQNNIFPTILVSTGLGGTTSTRGWMTCYHESDPKFATLGVDKFKCFIVDTTKTAQSSPSIDNVKCDGTVPAWLNTVPKSRTGWDGSNVTKEFTKIIPDGLLTPGAHVQYFFRKSHAIDPFLRFAMVPDTNLITPQSREGSTDEHRWQQFGVLPDRWKNAAFGGAGLACMLYVDLNDRRGNEGRFVGVMDSIGATATAKWGAHNGWHAPGDVDVNGLDVRNNMSVAVSNKNSQPGTTWDLYGVKAAESTTSSAGQLGSRLANRTNMGFAAGRESRQGPTKEMLRAYYRQLLILTGDLTNSILGPFANRSQDDVALLNDFLTGAGGAPQPRGIFFQGDGFAESEHATGVNDPAHMQFLADKLGLVFRSPGYVTLSANPSNCPDLIMTNAITATADIYGVSSVCNLYTDDVYTPNPAIPEAVPGAYYENVGVNGPYVSDIVKTAVPARNWVALTSGYDIEHLYGRYCDRSGGRLAYYYYMLYRVFGGICQCTCFHLVLDTPAVGRGRDVLDFVKVGNSVMRRPGTTVQLSVSKAGRVRIAIFDVAGRQVRELADRVFAAGEHTLAWDGADDAGARVARGVYFVRSSTQPESKRIIVLNN